MGGEEFSTSNALSAGKDVDVGLGGSEGSLSMDVEKEVLELGEDSVLILCRTGIVVVGSYLAGMYSESYTELSVGESHLTRSRK